MTPLPFTQFHKHRYVWLALVAGAIVILDQVTKALVLEGLPLYRSVPVIPGFFNLTHIQNPGGAFGLLARQPSGIRSMIFILVSVMALGFVLYFYRNTPRTHPLLALGFALIFGGAIGNLVDRIRFGQVVDFLDVYIGSIHWPAFNVADSAITVGITIFLFHLLFKKLPD